MKTKVTLTGEGLQLRCDSLDEDFAYEFPLIISLWQIMQQRPTRSQGQERQ